MKMTLKQRKKIITDLTTLVYDGAIFALDKGMIANSPFEQLQLALQFLKQQYKKDTKSMNWPSKIRLS